MRWLKHPLDRDIFRIAVPAFLGFLAFILFDAVNIFWIGRLGTSAMAGVASAAFLTWAVYAAMTATTAGANSLIAQAFGAGKRDEARAVAAEAAWLSMGACLLFMALLLPSVAGIFRLMGLQPETASYARQYLTIFACAMPLYYLCNLAAAVFNAYGDTRTNVLIMSSSVVINIVLDPVLILGWGTGRPFGAVGAASASAIATACALAVQIVFLRRRGYLAPLREVLRVPAFTRSLRILQIGVPAASVNVVWSLVYPALTSIITRFGEAPLAGLSVCFRLEGFPYFLGIGFSTAMAALVGQAYGRGDMARVREIVTRGRLLITALLLPVALAFIFIPHLLVRPLTGDPEVIAHAVRYLRVIGYFEIFLGWELMFEGVFTGLGHTRSYMLISVPLTVARWPAAWLLAITFGLGTPGVWWAISVSTLLKGIWASWLFHRGAVTARLLTRTEPRLAPQQ
ncbi:MAG: putative multidrug resistance protein [Elusimicrobia bacterium]|nr:MAG: putative multidrug resistance protein [Elusimicrobiota bacterium]KAF0154616.1 MAG: putative multidrug resistance protein [Elusimicrobiota bacterium]